MRRRTRIIVALILVFALTAFLAYSYWNSYWQTIPYATYNIGEEIIGFPCRGTSMTVDGFSTAPDRTFPQSSTDIFLNLTINRLGSSQNQNNFHEAANKFLALTFQTERGHGETSAWNGFNDSMGIFPLDNNSLTTNQSTKASILFVMGNGNYTSFQLVCRTESEQKPLFAVDLPGLQF